MTYRVGQFELDSQRFELRRCGTALPAEPQVLSLLLLLVENRHRLVTKDEIVEKIWDGRIVSDAAIASRLKSARQLLGDDGTRQQVIRTIYRKGFRFVAEVEACGSSILMSGSDAEGEAREEKKETRPSIAVLPLGIVGKAGELAVAADAIPHEIIAQLSRLRWLFVTARGSSFKFKSADPDVAGVGKLLGVNYCLCGTLESTGQSTTIGVELVDTRKGGIVWANRYTDRWHRVHEVRAKIVADIIVALELQIPAHEARRARLQSPDDLDAWSFYHLGLHRMFRFNRDDNAAANALFERAIEKDPDFARAYAGLSFTHFQSAFLKHSQDPAAEAASARKFADRAMEKDPLDPFANFTMGRTFWLEGDLESSLVWLDRATALSPNYAHGIYAQGWSQTLLSCAEAGRRHVDQAMTLSPLDPLRYAMLATRAMSHLVKGEEPEAAAWADRAAREPGAHVLIAVIATACHALYGNSSKAAAWARNVHARSPGISHVDFFRSFPFQDPAMRRRIAEALERYGL